MASDDEQHKENVPDAQEGEGGGMRAISVATSAVPERGGRMKQGRQLQQSFRPRLQLHDGPRNDQGLEGIDGRIARAFCLSAKQQQRRREEGTPRDSKGLQ